MTIRAIELLNKELKIFNQDNEEYKKFIGDITREDNINTGVTASETEYQASDFPGTMDDIIDFYDFLPVQSENSLTKLYIGNYLWESSDTVGSNKEYVGKNSGNTKGAIRFKLNEDDKWLYFAPIGDNGLKTLTIPSSSDTFDFYYDQKAWYNAFKGTNSEIIITNDGSVYKDIICSNCLVVNGAGEIGLLGGLAIIVKLNEMNLGSISNPVEYTRRLKDYLLRQLQINTASDDWLDYLGTDVFGITRIAGESDKAFSDRIISEVISVKMSPLAIQQALEQWADRVVVDDDIGSGAFADVTFSDYYIRKNGYNIGSLIGYVTGTDGNLNNPTDIQPTDYTSPFLSFLPMATSSYNMNIRFGPIGTDYTWYVDGSGSVGPNKSTRAIGGSSGTNYGSMKFYNPGGNWIYFADSSYNGIQRIYFPKNGINNNGGYIEFYYHEEAWKYAFEGNGSKPYIAVDGSVYKNGIEDDNLVVTADGAIGKAGGGDYYVIRPAIAGSRYGLIFYFQVTVYNIDFANADKIVNTLNNFRIAGVIYDLFERPG